MKAAAAESIKSEPEGLRITLAANRRTAEPVGLATTFPIKGNFEITVRYSLLTADQPQAGWEAFCILQSAFCV